MMQVEPNGSGDVRTPGGCRNLFAVLLAAIVFFAPIGSEPVHAQPDAELDVDALLGGLAPELDLMAYADMVYMGESELQEAFT